MPLYTEEGGAILKGQRSLDAAKRLLPESSYSGQPVTCLVARDVPFHKAWGDVTADLLKRLGMIVEYAAIDWGTVVARLTNKSPPGQGGWQMFPIDHPGADCSSPATNKAVRANGNDGFFGWPNSPQVEAEVTAWFDANTFDEQRTAVRRLNKAALDHVVYAPLGFYLSYRAWRKNVSGIVPGPLPFYWGVTKTSRPYSRRKNSQVRLGLWSNAAARDSPCSARGLRLVRW
jgi:peptide/nickel transport system substrate-binding protein